MSLFFNKTYEELHQRVTEIIERNELNFPFYEDIVHLRRHSTFRLTWKESFYIALLAYQHKNPQKAINFHEYPSAKIFKADFIPYFDFLPKSHLLSM